MKAALPINSCLFATLLFWQIAACAQNSIYGLSTETGFIEYDLTTGTRTVLRTDIFASSDNGSTYDSVNQRFFAATYNNLVSVDLPTNTKTLYGNVFGSNVSIEYDPEWDCLFGLSFGGSFTKYGLATGTKTILRNDIFVSEDNHSTYDFTNHRFFANTYNTLLMVDLVTGTKTSFGNVFGNYASIEYDPEWNCLFGLSFGGTFARFDLNTHAKTILRNDVYVSAENGSTYDPLKHVFYANTYDNLVTLDILAGTKTSEYNVFGRYVSIEYTVPEPGTIVLVGFSGLLMRRRASRQLS